MSARVKVCGVTSAADRDLVVDAGADALGVISGVPVDSPRAIDPEYAAELVAETPPFVTSVLVTMPDTAEDAVRLVRTVRPDAVQLHASDPETVAAVRRDAPARVLAAVDATSGTDELGAYAAVADALVLDSTDDEGAGGTGRTHDWDRARAVVAATEVPVVLAGGLTPDTVADAVATVEPFAVDVASGVERDGGVKDDERVRDFVRNATCDPDRTEVAP